LPNRTLNVIFSFHNFSEFSFNNHDKRDLLIITISWGGVGWGICEEVPGLDVSYWVGSVIVYIFCKTLFDGGLSSGFVSVIVTIFLSLDFVAPCWSMTLKGVTACSPLSSS